MTRAAEASKVSRIIHYKWLKEDPVYAAAFAEARRMGAEAMEDEATRRANEGVERAVYHKGKVVGHERYYSDVLLMFRIKGEMPDKYRERQDVSVTGNLRINIGGDDNLPDGI